MTQGARAIYADRLIFDKAAYSVRAGVKAGWSDPVRIDKLDESLLDLEIKTDIVPMAGPPVLIRSGSGERFEADWLALEIQSQTGQAGGSCADRVQRDAHRQASWWSHCSPA